ncbi:MAG TPA: hypothetical protein GXX36_01550 [Clostridiaceae bacterium]|nr:hypothetical protein [Clostridiaceae bacterium]
MAKKNLSTENQLKKYKKRFVIAISLLAVVTAFLGVLIYLNYDYLAFKYFISQHYIYTDALDELYKQEIKRDVNGKYFSYFDNVVISTFTKRIREINNDKYTYLYTPESYKQYKQEEKEEALASEIKVLDDKTIYMRLTNFSKYTLDFVRDNAEQLKKYPYLVIDLRDNYGGDIDAMTKISGMFLPKNSIIAVDKMRLLDWTYKSKGNKTFDYKGIAILQNKNTASSSENLIAALHDNLDNVVLVGETTFGKGIGQFTLPLKRGFAVKATVLLWYTPAGTNIQGKGIDPDIPYSGNDIVEFSVKAIKEQFK